MFDIPDGFGHLPIQYATRASLPGVVAFIAGCMSGNPVGVASYPHVSEQAPEPQCPRQPRQGATPGFHGGNPGRAGRNNMRTEFLNSTRDAVRRCHMRTVVKRANGEHATQEGNRNTAELYLMRSHALHAAHHGGAVVNRSSGEACTSPPKSSPDFSGSWWIEFHYGIRKPYTMRSMIVNAFTPSMYVKGA
jgi:hypothetical protein